MSTKPLTLPLVVGGIYLVKDFTMNKTYEVEMTEELGPSVYGEYVADEGRSLYYKREDGKAYAGDQVLCEVIADVKLPANEQTHSELRPRRPQLTLPPEIGRRYVYRHRRTGKQYECVIDCTNQFDGETIYISEPLYPEDDDDDAAGWTFWPDGKAKIPPYGEDDFVAVLIEDIPEDPDNIHSLRARVEEMQRKLKELGA